VYSKAVSILFSTGSYLAILRIIDNHDKSEESTN